MTKEDLAQEILIKFYASYGASGPFKDPAAQLATFTKNAVIDWIRKLENKAVTEPLTEDNAQPSLPEELASANGGKINGSLFYLCLEMNFRTPEIAIDLHPADQKAQQTLLAKQHEQPYLCIKNTANELEEKKRVAIYLCSWKKWPPNSIATYLNAHFRRKGGAEWKANTVSNMVSNRWKGRFQSHYTKMLQSCLISKGFPPVTYFDFTFI